MAKPFQVVSMTATTLGQMHFKLSDVDRANLTLARRLTNSKSAEPIDVK
jgi:hypothetical protein